MKNKNGRTI